MQMGEFREAIQYFSNVVAQRPKNISSWEALIRCLYIGEYYDEAVEQVDAAIRHTDNKPIFTFYLSAIYFAKVPNQGNSWNCLLTFLVFKTERTGGLRPFYMVVSRETVFVFSS